MKKYIITFFLLFVIGFIVGVKLGFDHRTYLQSDEAFQESIYRNSKLIRDSAGYKIVLTCESNVLLEYNLRTDVISESISNNIYGNTKNSELSFFVDVTKGYSNYLVGGLAGTITLEKLMKSKGKLPKGSNPRKMIVQILGGLSGVTVGYLIARPKSGECPNMDIQDFFVSKVNKNPSLFKKEALKRILKSYLLYNESQDSTVLLVQSGADRIIGYSDVDTRNFIDSLRKESLNTEKILEAYSNSPLIHKDLAFRKIIALVESKNQSEIKYEYFQEVSKYINDRISKIKADGIKEKGWQLISTTEYINNLISDK